MKGVDYIEEAKDYEKVIHGIKDLLENPRQHMPLGASSTANISYHTSQLNVSKRRSSHMSLQQQNQRQLMSVTMQRTTEVSPPSSRKGK